MKKILVTIALFLSFNIETRAEAPLVLEYSYKDEATKISMSHLEDDTEFCCHFEIINKKIENLQEDMIRIIDKKSGICLGILYGIPNKQFLMKLYITELNKESVNDIVSKLELLGN